MSEFRIVPAGDSALLLELPPRIDSAISDRVLALARAVEERYASAVRDLVVGYCSLTVYFDPRRIDAGWLEMEIRATAAAVADSPAVEGVLIDVPVCYGGDFGPDLAAVARAADCSEQQVVALHTALTYRVYVVGFVPGFPYMASVDPRLSLPRRPTPRDKVPAGSVAIAAGQTGIYPSETPGGWHLLGRTPVKPFDPSRPRPFLFKVGDRVRFHAIDRTVYDEWPP